MSMIEYPKCSKNIFENMSESNLSARFFSRSVNDNREHKRNRLIPMLTPKLEKKIFVKMSESDLLARKNFFQVGL